MNTLLYGTTSTTTGRANSGTAIWTNPQSTTREFSTGPIRIMGTPPSDEIHFSENQLAKLWDQMYVKAIKVIIPCPHCRSHNAISNPTCVRCGGPMGAQ